MASAEYEPVEHEIHRASGLVQINVATAAMIRSEMKHDAHSINCMFGHSHFPQVAFDKFDGAVLNIAAYVLEFSAAEIVHHPNLRTTLEQRMDQIGADEGGPSSDEHFAIFPVHFSSEFLFELRNMK
jgi:hypothetical protein